MKNTERKPGRPRGRAARSRISIDVPPRSAALLKLEAEAEGISVSALVRRLVHTHLKRKGF